MNYFEAFTNGLCVFTIISELIPVANSDNSSAKALVVMYTKKIQAEIALIIYYYLIRYRAFEYSSAQKCKEKSDLLS